MEMPAFSCFILSLLLLFLPILTSSNSIHDVLKFYGLPPGLFPKTVVNFTFDPFTGLLEAYLEKPCFAKYDVLAYFDRVVTGNLTCGELKDVTGLQQRELFVWLPVMGIFNKNPKSGVIMFDIALARKQLSMSLFEKPPECMPDGILIVGTEILGRKGMLQEER